MSAATPNHPEQSGGGKLRALLAEFDSPDALLAAARKVRDAGFRKWDTHSPYPLHGIDAATGIRPTRLPWLVFAAGAVGCAVGLAMQWWTNATGAGDFPLVPTFLQGYDYLTSGKPKFSLPANIPVVFEVTVLFAACAAVLGLLVSSNLPWLHNPLHASARFKRVTADRFFVRIDADDPHFDEKQTAEFLLGLGGSPVEHVEEIDSSPARLPQAFVFGGLIVACLAFVPVLLVVGARVFTSHRPRVHIVQDMDNQERFQAQQGHPLFADGRAARPQIADTVARGDLREDAHFYYGRVDDAWATTFPPQIKVTKTFVRRGQERFNIHCAPCHGLGGAGDGIVSIRALELNTPGWVIPTPVLDEKILEAPHGGVFNAITNGLRTMPPLRDQVPEADCWAIIAYIRALQRSQNARLEDVPPELRPELRQAQSRPSESGEDQ